MYNTGRFTLGTSGNVSITGVGFKPKFARFTVAKKVGVNENTQAHFSVGRTDGTRQSAQATCVATSGNHTRDSGTECVIHFEGSSGTLSQVLSASFVSFDTDGITLNVATPNANYQVTAEFYG